MLARNQNNLGFDHAGITDHATARFDNGFGHVVAKVVVKRINNRSTVCFGRRNIAQVTGREATTHIDHTKMNAFVCQGTED